MQATGKPGFASAPTGTVHLPGRVRFAERVWPGSAATLFASCLDRAWQKPMPIFSGVPVLVDAQYRSSLQKFCAALGRALQAVVQSYQDDPRIRAIYALPADLEALLTRAAGSPYRLGFYRPDLIYDRTLQPRLCEVGARYPFNGWVISTLAQACLDAHPSLLAADWHTLSLDLQSVLLARYPAGSTVALIHANEAGSEVHHVLAMLRVAGVQAIACAPGALQLRQDRLVAHTCGQAVTVDYCVLELDRSELHLFAPDVLTALIDRRNYDNDVRTLILVHDKRVLVVLGRPDILRDLVSAEDAGVLQPWLIASATGNDAAARARLIDAGHDLIAKRNSGGRGVDAMVRSLAGETAWRTLVEHAWPDYMFQEYLPQHDFHHAALAAPLHLVGMALCCDDHCFGPGLFRGSREAVINVHQGRGQIHLPVALR